MKNMRHVVNVMRPTKNRASLGQIQGIDETVMSRVPCSIDNLAGKELELARSTFASASLKVEMYGDPKKPLKTEDYLQFGARKLHIVNINDEQQNGVKLTLLCGEQV